MSQILELIQSIDFSVILWIYQNGANPLLDTLAETLHWIGTFRIPAILLGIFFWFKKETRPITFVLFAAVLASLAATHLIKELADRPRPFIMLGLTAADMLILTDPTVSFPSGHATSAFATATVVSYYFRKWAVPAFAAAVAAGLARMYLLVHYPSDVIAGALVGIIVSLAVIYAAEKLQKRETFTFLRRNAEKKGDASEE